MFLIEYLDRYNKSNSIRHNRNDYVLCTLPDREMQQYGCSKTVYGGLFLNVETVPFATDSSIGSVNFPVSESVLKRILQIFLVKGFRAALDEARNELTLEEQPLIYRLANVVHQLLYSYKYLNMLLCLGSPDIEPENIANFVETKDWLNSIVRCIAWHPKCSKFAVAGFDDIVRIFVLPTWHIARLSIIPHKQITCMAWRPICGNEIVIGCNNGMCIWTIEKQQLPIFQFVLHPNGLPIVSMQWNKNGTLLATASFVDSVIMLWEADSMKWMPLKCYGSPITMIKWAPENEWLFSGTTDTTFCIWDCDNLWKQNRWDLVAGSMQSACWSPCGTYLVFVTKTEPFLYRLKVETIEHKKCKKYNPDTDFNVSTLADLRQHSVGNTIVGGMPQQLAWDFDGRFLCITFKNSDCIVIFHTYLQSDVLQISPAFYIEENHLGVYPSFICFQSKHSRNKKIVLTIGWSSGRIQHCKLI